MRLLLDENIEHEVYHRLENYPENREEAERRLQEGEVEA